LLFLSVAAFLALADFVAWTLLPGRTMARGVSEMVGYTVLALYSHRMILLGETISWKHGPDAGELKIGRFIGVFFGFIFAAYATLMILMVAILPFLDDLYPWTGKEQTIAAALLAAPAAILLYGVAMALVGGVLPAIAVNADASLGAAFARGRARFWRTLFRLATGPLLFSALSIGLLATVMNALPQTVAASPAVTIVASFLPYLSGVFAVHLTAVALSMSYLEAGGEVPKVTKTETPVSAAPSSRR